jgi:hypothetical protein
MVFCDSALLSQLWFDRIRGGLAPHKMAPSI